MGRKLKKFASGEATTFVSRNKALKMLQLSLADFRRLCILKGIYPQEPRHPKKVNKGSTALKTFYLKKNIQFLAHEPLIHKFREYKIYARRLRKAICKREKTKIRRVKEGKPVFDLAHLVKERYPSLLDAVDDLDDCISLVYLFSLFPKTSNVPVHIITLCRRLSVEFMHYIISSQSLRKVFISIKGIYYQAEVLGKKVTWVIPHERGYSHPSEVDYRIMGTFVDFYCHTLGFINWALYNKLGLIYPPRLLTSPSEHDVEDVSARELVVCRLASLSQPIMQSADSASVQEENNDEFVIDDDIERDNKERRVLEIERLKKLKSLFSSCKFFLNREVPRETLTFVIRSFGGLVSWERSSSIGAPYPETDSGITHHVVDRPRISNTLPDRTYVQPQWIFDSVNAGLMLSTSKYAPGAELPPHFSPFVEKSGDSDKGLVYEPPEMFSENHMEEIEEDSDDESEIDEIEASDDEDEVSVEETSASDTESKDTNIPAKKVKVAVTPGEIPKVDKNRQAQMKVAEELRLREMMIKKKDRRLYHKIRYSEKKRRTEVNRLTDKRKEHDEKQKKMRAKKMSRIAA